MPLKRQKSWSDEFMLLDRDNDGTITKDDLITALQKRLPEISNTAANTWADGVMRLYDKDSNGLLEKSEVGRWPKYAHRTRKLNLRGDTAVSLYPVPTLHGRALREAAQRLRRARRLTLGFDNN